MPRRNRTRATKAEREAAGAAQAAETEALRAELERRLRAHAAAHGYHELLRRIRARGLDTTAFERPLPPGYDIGWTDAERRAHQLFMAPRDRYGRPLPGSLPTDHPAYVAPDPAPSDPVT